MLEARVNDDDKTTIMNIVKNNLEEMKKKFDGKGFSVAIHADLSFGNKLHITVIREEELQKWTSQRILHLSSSVNREKNIKLICHYSWRVTGWSKKEPGGWEG